MILQSHPTPSPSCESVNPTACAFGVSVVQALGAGPGAFGWRIWDLGSRFEIIVIILVPIVMGIVIESDRNNHDSLKYRGFGSVWTRPFESSACSEFGTLPPHPSSAKPKPLIPNPSAQKPLNSEAKNPGSPKPYILSQNPKP